MCAKNYDQLKYSSWDMVRDDRTDGRRKWDIEVGAPPKKINKNLKYLMTKKVYKKNFFFSVITKNLNWKISSKNLVTFKRQDGVKDEKLWCFEHPLLGGSSRKTNIEGGIA